MSDANQPGPSAEFVQREEHVEAQLPALEAQVERAAGEQSEPAIQQLLLFLPRLVRFMWRLACAPDVATRWKIRCGIVIAYIFSPIDVIPDVIPVVGLLDDLYLAVLLTDQLFNHVPQPIVDRCWTGDRGLVDTVRRGIGLVAKLLPAPVRTLLDGWVGDAGITEETE